MTKLQKISLIIAAAALSACTTYESQSFVSTQNSEVESSFVATDADFGQYDKLFAQDMGIYFPPDAAPTAADMQRTRAIFREAFLSQLGGYTVVREAAPGALEVQASLVDFRNAGNASVPSLSTELGDIAQPGAVVFLMELKDPESGRTLARAADSASTPGLSTSEAAATDWESVQTAAQRWAVLFRQFLDQNLGR